MTYQEVLKSVGHPEEVLIIDFETYFDQEYSLSKMSTIEYIQDPRFEFTGCGFATLPFGQFDGPVFTVKPDLEWYIKLLQEQYGKNLERVTVIAKNAKFDMAILAIKFRIIPPYIIDIDDLLRHYDARMSHRMKDVTKMFGLQSKGDTNQFKGLHYEEMDTETRKKLKNYSKNDVEIESSLFTILLPKITNPVVEIPIARHTLDLYLRPHFKFDMPGAYLLAGQMQQELQAIIDATGYTQKQLSGNKIFTKLLSEALPEDESVPMKAGKRGNIPAFAKDDVAFQLLLAHPDPVVQQLCVARQSVKSWPLHIKRIFNMVKQARVSGGKLRVPLNYYGGHTGRWSGGEKINLQNLGGQGRAGSGVHPLIQKMRNLLRVPNGYTLGIADSSQVEARILAWLAGQDDLVKGFADGEDIYSVFATELFGVDVHKPKEADPADAQQLLKIRRGFGKDAILGCGYGMGTNTFYQRCIANSDLRPYFDSGSYDWDFIHHLINTYRTTYKRIPEFWKAVEKAFKWVIKYPHEQAQVSRIYDENDNAAGFRLMFFNQKGTVHLRLPSGRELTYRHCVLDKKSTIKWRWGKLWGGSITENIVQAVARDLLAYWILEMDKAGLQIALHNHDEIVCVIPKDDAGDYLDEMCDIMHQGPEWANGLPLDAEGVLTDVYTK